MLKVNFLPKFSIIIVLSFILFTIIGTITHEFGHIAIAKYFGYDTTISYGSMSYSQDFSEDEDVKEIKKISEPYMTIDYEEWPEDVKLKLEALDKIVMERYPYNETYKLHELLITIGGPAQTLLTSFIGLLILFFRRKKWKDQFRVVDWLAVFMSLFALREVFNFVQVSYSALFNSESNFNADEFKISRYLGFNEWIIPVISLIVGLTISIYVIFKIIPIKYRFSFIVSGLVGGISGFAIWFGFLGELLFGA
ncbi:hypothetical protein [Winogradskyella psychrotolerans]|uniref:hypothetical protein n=1 Tax=Winogradskyella psychrotolerans TaxID=1344585 RepID=UPI001C06DE4B|nr:hypothetical protein [Winogradskyella psychrotolerans]MBU2929936.1 hypothetical protein [Winogradskyella psychrotolerans]